MFVLYEYSLLIFVLHKIVSNVMSDNKNSYYKFMYNLYSGIKCIYIERKVA